MGKKLSMVSFGGGTNSTAMMIGLIEKNIKVDLILFADTGAERPETYRHIEIFSDWLNKQGYPVITKVQQVNKKGEKITIEEDCIRLNQMPSLVYGIKQCSQKFKLFPQEKFLNNYPLAIDVWKAGNKVVKYVGFDADEDHRIKDHKNEKYEVKYPLVEWGWGRAECVKVIAKAGISLPGKSSCFMCPSTKKHEITSLKYKHPDLLSRALFIEDNALSKAQTVAGLGRHFRWRDFVNQGDLFPEIFQEQYIETACGCYDGN